MSCYGCSKKYGLFTKEYGCPNCGFSYCLKCLKRPIAVPKHGNKVLNVCVICYDKLTKIQANEKVLEDIEALPGTIVTASGRRGGGTKSANATEDIVTLLEDNPPEDLPLPVIPQSSSSAANTVDSTVNEENPEIAGNLDCMITKRLKDLKTVDNMPSDDDLRARLSNLSGMPQKDYSKKDLLLSTDTRTDQEKMRDLLQQFMGEAELDQRVEAERNDSISDIERRLKALREQPIDGAHNVFTKAKFPDTNTPSDNEQDDETVLKAIMEKYLAEAKLPSADEQELASSIPRPPPGTKPEDVEELPWCNICNEDAVLRCKGCDGELFCAQCFRECHDDDEEYRAHVREKYSAPPKFKENHF